MSKNKITIGVRVETYGKIKELRGFHGTKNLPDVIDFLMEFYLKHKKQ